ncbi:MAG: uncharacterized protein KVP18_002279, partial [Porospora cf. gigantea A]
MNSDCNFETITANFSIFEELPSKMLGMKTFAKIDILKCFDFFPLSEESRKFFAFLGPDGELWTLNSIPQGYKNAPAVVHAQLRSILHEACLPDSSAAANHLDDIMIGATHAEALWEALEKILSLLIGKYNFRVNWPKCVLGVPEVNHLGYLWSAEGYRMPPDRALVLHQLRRPTNPSEIRSFLAWACRYARFHRELPRALAPISDLLKKDAETVWTPELDGAFSKVKELIASDSTLTYPDWTKPFEVYLDWSKTAVSATLEQEQGPIVFEGRKCRQHEVNYSSFDGEASAL